MDTVVDRLIRYAKVYSESDYHAGRAVTPSTQRQFDYGPSAGGGTPRAGHRERGAGRESVMCMPLCLPHRAVNICPPSA